MVGVVTLLVVIALVSVRGIHDRQRASACKAELAKVQTAVEAYRAMLVSQNRAASLPPNLAALKFVGLLDGQIGRYVAYSRVRLHGRWEPRYANGPKGNCVPS